MSENFEYGMLLLVGALLGGSLVTTGSIVYEQITKRCACCGRAKTPAPPSRD